MPQIWNPYVGAYIDVPDDQVGSLNNTENLGHSPWSGAGSQFRSKSSDGNWGVDAKGNAAFYPADGSGTYWGTDELGQTRLFNQTTGLPVEYPNGATPPENVSRALSNPNGKNSFGQPIVSPSTSAAAANSAKTAPAAAAPPAEDPMSRYIRQIQEQYGVAADKNQAVIDDLGRQNNELNSLVDTNHVAKGFNLADLYAADNDYVARSQGLTDLLGKYASESNTAQWDNTNKYAGQMAGYNASNNAAVSKLGGLYDSLATPLKSQVTWDGDLTSQAAIADPTALAAQNKALDYLGGAMGGSLDVKPGQLDPAAYQSALEAMDKYKQLSDPKVTAQEQFMFEQARLKQQQDEMGIRAALESNLRQRGMLGSGMEIAGSALQGQQTSQNRLLSDLGALANADARSMAALSGWSTAAQGLNAQANELATGNSNRRLAGGVAYGNQANTMQQQTFNRGMAADNMAQFNRASSIDVAKFNSLYDQRERDSQWSRGTDMTDAIMKGNELNAKNDTNVFNAVDKTIGDAYLRNRDVVGMQDNTNTRANAAVARRVTTTNAWLDDYTGQKADALARSGNLAGLQMGNNNMRASGSMDVTKLKIADYTGQKAAIDARIAAQGDPNDGLLGTFILSKNDPFNPTNWFRGKLGNDDIDTTVRPIA